MLEALNNIDSVEERKREREHTFFDILKLVIVWGYFHQPLRL